MNLFLPNKSSYRMPPILFVFITLFVAGIMVIPLVYLLLRIVQLSVEDLLVLVSSRAFHTLSRSLILMICVTTLSSIIALPLAWITARTDLRFRKIWTILVMLPLVIPSYVGAYIFLSVFGTTGLLQKALEIFFEIQRLPDIRGLFGATLVLSLLSYPYLFITLRGAISGLDVSMEESSRILGYSRFWTFMKVTLPQLRFPFVSGALLISLYTLSDFGAVSIFNYNTFSWTIYQQYNSLVDRSMSALFSIIFVLLAFLIVLIEFKSRGFQKYYRIGSGISRKPKLIPLGFWRFPVYVFLFTVIGFALFLPISMLGVWLLKGMYFGDSITFSWTPIFNSVLVSIISALLIVFFSFATAIILVRYSVTGNRLFESISYLGFVLPGVVVAISVVYFAANYAGILYQTTTLLVLAYVILFFPVALGAIRSVLLQINPRLEDAAHSMSQNYYNVLMRINLPLMRPGLIMAFAMVFLLVMKELPVTLILGPLGFKTLATEVWSFSSEAFFASAAIPALMIILICSLPMLVIIIWDKRIGD